MLGISPSVRAKLGLIVAPKHHKQGSTLPKRINVSLLKNPESITQFQVSIQGIPPLDPVDHWSHFRDSVFEASSKVLGFKKRKRTDCFDVSDQNIANLLKQKHDLHTKLLSLHQEPQSSTIYNNVKSSIQTQLRVMKDN